MRKAYHKTLKEQPKYKQEIAEKVRIKIDTEEQYIEKSKEIDLFDFYNFMDGCQSVYIINPMDAKYVLNKHRAPFYGSFGLADTALSMGIYRNKIDRATVPLIPIMEYKLVPTGNIEYYDATLTNVQRRNRRYKQTLNGRLKLQKQGKERRQRLAEARVNARIREEESKNDKK